MPKLHTGEESRPGDILGFNPGKYPRKDDKGNKLEGHGMYVLEGEELQDFLKLSIGDIIDTTKINDKEILERRRKLMGDPYEQLEYLAQYGLHAFQVKWVEIARANPLSTDGLIDIINGGTIPLAPPLPDNPVEVPLGEPGRPSIANAAVSMDIPNAAIKKDIING